MKNYAVPEIVFAGLVFLALSILIIKLFKIKIIIKELLVLFLLACIAVWVSLYYKVTSYAGLGDQGPIYKSVGGWPHLFDYGNINFGYLLVDLFFYFSIFNLVWLISKTVFKSIRKNK